jgi:RNA polymerase sigma factor (sigma-70 family)
MNPPLNLYATRALAGAKQMESATSEDLQCAVLIQLIQRMSQGDEAALAHFYGLTLSRVYALALRIAGRRDLAEEVCVETYWQAWREAVRYDAQRGQPMAWLMVMARSRTLDALRRLDTVAYCPDPEIYLDGESCPDGSPLDQLMAAEQSSALGRALAALTPVQRQMVGLAFYKDLSHQEISAQTGLPLGTVKSHLKRAQDTLRIALRQA